MKIRGHTTTVLAVPLAVAAVMLLGTGTGTAYAQAKGMGAPSSKVEITIKDRQHGYETVGITMPSQETVVVVRNLDTVTHGFASNLFKEIPVRMEGQASEVRGKNFKSFHIEPGHTMTLHFATAPSQFGPAGGAESLRYVLWCDIHPEVKGELYIIETRGEIGGG